jgi:hypothetical protein
LDLANQPKNWTSFPSLPLEVAYAALAFVPSVNRLYAIGGDLGINGLNQQVMMFSMATQQWSFTGNKKLFNHSLFASIVDGK